MQGHDPTAAEIAAETALIRAGWSLGHRHRCRAVSERADETDAIDGFHWPAAELVAGDDDGFDFEGNDDE
ncbi:hypothetical protein SAMN05421753_11789 [Planctomicrobium piriforme]|uniref:Uncharacterized protein n=1 Tax=Planctomicrobium piriforme TaxID=1576369 RepID=A0A1I3PZR7_9PLAN|nr:hypothetical protein SAMN05421753_11789 [Planctomicrobium piriforme]